MYNFTDKENHEVTLRPEMTPTLARMVLQMQNAATGEFKQLLPFKWFSLPQCWRFETTQRGRKREHYQWNMDIVGVTEITAEVGDAHRPRTVLCALCTVQRESSWPVGAGGRPAVQAPVSPHVRPYQPAS